MLQRLFVLLKWLLWLYHSMGVGRKILNNGGKVLKPTMGRTEDRSQRVA
jgi:hypothetical protein